MILETLFIGWLQVTAYRSVPAQTDSSPNWTSIGHHTHPYGCAVSQDLLANGSIRYGDYICLEGLHCCVVNDTMNKRHKKHVDVWVATYEEERDIVPKKRRVIRVRGK